MAEVSSLVCLDLRKSNFCSSKLDLRIFGLVLLVSSTSGTLALLVPLVLLVLLVLWFSSTSGTLLN